MANTRDSIRVLALRASVEFVISQDQAKRILQEVIDLSTKREHHMNKLAFTRKCIHQKIAFNKIENATKKLKLSRRDTDMIKEKMMKNIRREMYKDLQCVDVKLQLSIREAKSILSKDDWKILDVIRVAKIRKKRRKSKKIFTKKFEWLHSKKVHSQEEQIPKEFDGINFRDVELPEEFKSEPRVYGGIIINDAEKELLSLPSKFPAFKKLDC